MGFKAYVKIADLLESKALIREGTEVFGSVKKLADKIDFSSTHVHRWYNAESGMCLKDFNEIKAIIAKEKKRKELKV
jgi:AraC-like DNA-binding protein